MEYIKTQYLILLVISWIVAGWIYMVKADSESTYDYIPLHDTLLYRFFMVVPILAIIVSLVINTFKVGFISSLCYIGILVLVQIININIIYKIYRYIFGRGGFGTLIPLIAIIPLIIYLFIIQYA